MKDNKSIEWEREFNRVRNNPIYFLETYFNIIHPESKPSLTDDEKQRFFDQYKGIPLLKEMSDFVRHTERIDELKKQGYKDWQIH